MYKTIIFDFFEVIHEDPLEVWLTRRGYKRREGPFAEVCAQLDLGQITYKDYVGRLAELLEEPLEDFVEQFEASAGVHVGMPELLGKLRSRHHTGLLSNTTAEEISPLLKRHNLQHFFDEIIISADTGFKKPDAAIFHLALRRLDAVPEETIFIDDNPANVAAANRLGITGIRYTGVAALYQQLRNLSVIFDTSG